MPRALFQTNEVVRRALELRGEAARIDSRVSSGLRRTIRSLDGQIVGLLVKAGTRPSDHNDGLKAVCRQLQRKLEVAGASV